LRRVCCSFLVMIHSKKVGGITRRQVAQSVELKSTWERT
jgi:hypothetical protein